MSAALMVLTAVSDFCQYNQKNLFFRKKVKKVDILFDYSQR